MSVRAFCRDRQGNYAIMFALVLPVILSGVGFSLDIVSAMSARAKLQNSLDAALLAASRLADSTLSRQEVFDKFFLANAVDSDFLAADATLTVEEGLNYIETNATAWADVEMQLGFLYGNSLRVGVSAGAFESTNELEVALVLDNTGSMEANDRIGALRTAATTLVNILENASSPERSVKIALVPFVTAVNIRAEGYEDATILSWMDTAAKGPLHGANFDWKSGKPVNHFDLFNTLPKDTSNKAVGWKGCVEARPSPHNEADTVPDAAIPASLFVPYFAPDEPGSATTAGNEGAKLNNSYLADVGASGTDAQKQKSTAKYVSTTFAKIDQVAPLTNGPNRACPTPVVPLTDDFDKLRTAISGMKHWNGSGTNVSEGLAWGWRILSPAVPFTEGDPFHTEKTSKVVVLLTDGENVVFGSSGTFNKSDYGSYGFLASNRFGVSTVNQTNAARKVDDWTQNMCTQLKIRGVEIFTVLLQSDTAANRALYSACASKPENYFPTNDVSELEAVFARIGSAVAKLYVTN